jgi:adenylyltransferase/sulfurtransferase
MGCLDDSFRFEIECRELAALLEYRENMPFRLIDCREQDEYDLCHIAGSELMPLSNFASIAQGFPDLKERMVIYCHHGMRSLQATKYLRSRGHEHVFSMAGGIDVWADTIDPSLARY